MSTLWATVVPLRNTLPNGDPKKSSFGSKIIQLGQKVTQKLSNLVTLVSGPFYKIGRLFLAKYLVENRSDFFSVDPDGEKGLLVVVRRDVQDEEVGAAERGREDTGVGVHSSADVAA